MLVLFSVLGKRGKKSSRLEELTLKVCLSSNISKALLPKDAIKNNLGHS